MSFLKTQWKKQLPIGIFTGIVFYFVDKCFWLYRQCVGNSLFDKLGVMFLHLELLFYHWYPSLYLGRKLESTLESIQKEVDRHNAIVEKDVKLSFYAAECEDFPILGEYHENIETFEEAIKIYENLKKDRFLGDEGIGFKLTVNGKYKGRFTLIQGANRLIGLEKEGSFMDHPMINQAVDKAKRYVKSFEKSEMIQATVKRNTTKIEL